MIRQPKYSKEVYAQLGATCGSAKSAQFGILSSLGIYRRRLPGQSVSREHSEGDVAIAAAAASLADGEFIQVRGARVHNLRNLDVDLPRDKLIVITGVSGSGKSSLALDTIVAEGQRQYIETLSVYARQFLHQMERPDVDLIEGLQPTVSIDQRAAQRQSAQHGGDGHRNLRLPAAPDGSLG